MIAAADVVKESGGVYVLFWESKVGLYGFGIWRGFAARLIWPIRAC